MATSIPFGAMHERCNFRAMLLFSCFNILIFVFPAHWMWSDIGFLKGLGAVDVAGSGCIHIVGGWSALVGAYMLKPRIGYKGQNERIHMGNAKMACAGLFMIWWGTQAFNSGRCVEFSPKNILDFYLMMEISCF